RRRPKPPTLPRPRTTLPRLRPTPPRLRTRPALRLNRKRRLPSSRDRSRALPATIGRWSDGNTRMKTLLALLFLVLPVVACAADAPAPIVEGRDYVVVQDGQPYRPLDGQIEVVEVFAYTCPHCA